MKIDLFFSVIVFIFLLGCSEGVDSGKELHNGIGLSYDLEKLASICEHTFDSSQHESKMIKLELTYQGLIDDISKLLVYKNWLFILIMGENKDVLIFDQDDGRFIYSFKFNHPELLSDVTDFEIYKNRIYINNYDRKIVSVFDVSNIPSVYFQRMLESDLRFDKFSIIDSDNILVYPYMASLNTVENQILNYDLMLLDQNLNLKNSYLPYPVEKFHYGPSYNSTAKINFIAPFYKSEKNDIYFADLMKDTTYTWDSETKEIIPFAYHKHNNIAEKIIKEVDLNESIALMQNSGRPFGVQIFYADEQGFIFSSVVGSKVHYIYISFSTYKYRLLNVVDFENEMSLTEVPMGLPFLYIDSGFNVYAVIIPHLYPESELKTVGLKPEDNPAIVKYNLGSCI